ncbi:unnamed protein product, partial [Meganyctiphanes norvegica]
MAYQLYRNTTLGNTLQESLDELIQFQQISPSLALRVLLQFDRSINNALANKLRARISFKFLRLNSFLTFLVFEIKFRKKKTLILAKKLRGMTREGGSVGSGEEQKKH